MYFIEENDKPRILERLFKIIKIDNNRLILPIEKNEINEKILKKLVIKTKNILDKTKSKKIVLSKKLQEDEIYLNMLYSFGYEIVDGRWLFEAISCNILDYVTSLKNIKKEETEISVLVNNLTEYTLENIKKLAEEYKRLNIVTNHIEKFRKIEEKIYNENGLMITVTNNKKKSLNKSKIILNIDFPKELLNKYNIYENAIIVNICGNIKINKKRFNGIIINDYEIKLKSLEYSEINLEKKYHTKDLYEADFYKNIPYIEVIKKIKKDGLEIEYLVGNNGPIHIDSSIN